MPFYADRGQHPRRPLTPSAAAAEGHSRNVQKSVTQIIYLGPLPTAGAYFNSRLPDGLLGYCQPAHVCSPKYINPPLLTLYSCATDVDPISQSSVLANLFFPSLYPVATADQCNSLINASAFK